MVLGAKLVFLTSSQAVCKECLRSHVPYLSLPFFKILYIMPQLSIYYFLCLWKRNKSSGEARVQGELQSLCDFSGSKQLILSIT